MKNIYISIIFFLFFIAQVSHAQPDVLCGAQQTEMYISLLKGKNVALISNHTSLIGTVHLVDTLLKQGIKIKCVFCPEHGFRGTADAGELLGNHTDKQSNLPIISLYRKQKKPSVEELKDVDVVVFDLQDVGVRFYTYLSTLHYVMEACAEQHIPLIVLDRPNPNGFYIDGPVLDTRYSSFVGLHPVPLVYGMTIGEYAQMINGEGWLKNSVKCELTIIPCRNYTHATHYQLPVKPSPNLMNMEAVYLYPSLGLFEGTVISVARGTNFPFRAFGHPEMQNCSFTFTPHSIEGISKNPLYDNKLCHGVDLRSIRIDSLVVRQQLDLSYLRMAMKNYKGKKEFFNSFFTNLVGNKDLKQQLINGYSDEQIRESWKPGIEKFLKIRQQYLLYK
jgi:uncharacterized protein YbbC (DUF1343 family)